MENPDRVEILQRNFLTMQVCAKRDASDEEILKTCNEDNPAGTTNGWCQVVRKVEDMAGDNPERFLPITCEKDSLRIHFIVLC
jgi:hypothetical protein